MSENPFKIINPQVDENHAKQASTEIPTGFDEADTMKRIEKIINSNSVIVFMKGNAFVPKCGFSANTLGILTHLNAEFKTYDILQDPELRQAIKEFSNWPTFPQVYLKGKLIGGNDIMTEMYQSGDLAKIIS